MLVAFVALATSTGFKIDAKSTRFVKRPENNQFSPEEDPSSPGCWLCGYASNETRVSCFCPDDWCAETANDCPYQTMSVQLAMSAKNIQRDPDETFATENAALEKVGSAAMMSTSTLPLILPALRRWRS